MLEQLNLPQKEAVIHGNGPLLILAGAGSGKTRVLTTRIAHLIRERNIPPQQILAVTFTNKAAGEMRNRLNQLVGTTAINVWLGTFHSTCLKILRQFSETLGFSPNFVVYDEQDQLSLIRSVIKELNLDEKRFSPTGLVHRISRFKDQLTPSGVILTLSEAKGKDLYLQTLGRIYQRYNQLLKQNDAMDFGDLIFHCVRLFEEHPKILHQHQKRWQHILIDEYQDTNHAQYRFVRLLVEPHQNICVVGDPDQSIYRFRGADIHNILNFENDFASARVIRLEQNYRSTQNILSASTAVVSNNTERKEKNLWTSEGAGEKIRFAVLPEERAEADFIVQQLQEGRSGGFAYREMACFYRTNAQSRALEEALQRANVPYLIYGGIRFYERSEVKDALAYLRLFISPQDGISFQRIFNAPPRGIGAVTLEAIAKVQERGAASFLEAMKMVCRESLVGTAALKRLKQFLDWLEKLPSELQNLSPVEKIQKILESSGYIAWLQAKGPVEGEERLENINELLAAISDFMEENPAATLTDFLDRVTLASDLDQADESGVVSLMTLHLAKGLEFRFVSVSGLEEGLLPHARSLNTPEELEEERRLMYVGMTRARERLLLTLASRRFVSGTPHYGLRSRFLEEIPQQYLDVIASGSSVRPELVEGDWDFDQRPERERVRGHPSTALGASGTGNFPVGSQVQHPQFGAGTVRAWEKSTQGEKIIVQFQNGMLKRLIAEYANLTKLSLRGAK